MNTRELVLDMLLELEKEQEYANVLLKNVLDKYNYEDARDKAFIKRLFEGTLERRIELDYILDHFSTVSVSKMKPLIRNLLRMSVYQILYMDSVPDSAACSEAVKLAGRRKFSQLKGFVNGLLRNIARNKDNLTWPDPNKNQAEYLSVRYSFPKWLIEKWFSDYGTLKTEKILKGLLEERPVIVRFKKEKPAEEIEAIQKAGASLEKHPFLPGAWIIKKSDNIAALPGFLEGAFTVQDASSMLAVEAAGIGENDQVLDVCAAPGGKTMLAAQKAAKGAVLARDVSEYKVEKIRENVTRMQYDNIKLQIFDGRVLDEELIEKADVVLADVPCSGLGVAGRKADIKYHVTKEGMEELAVLQRQILENALQYVKPGGVLLFSTCTINPAENEEQALWLAEKKDFFLESLDTFIPEEMHSESTKKGMLQLFPGEYHTDGFFIARLRREG